MRQLDLISFEYENHMPVRTVEINGDIWIHFHDVCDVLEIANTGNAAKRLDDDEWRTVHSADSSVRPSRTNPRLVSESGFYSLVFQSRKPEAERFQKWVTKEVLPTLRRTGKFQSHHLPIFVRRFNDNWGRVDPGYFSIINECFIRVYGRLEQVGYHMPDKGSNGKEIRPDVSVGILFPKWLDENYPLLMAKRRRYSHLLPGGAEVEAWQYRNELLPQFLEFVETEWIPSRAWNYFKVRDDRALEYLPKLLSDKSRETGNTNIQRDLLQG